MQSRLPYQVLGAVTAALALSFAAGASVNAAQSPEAGKAEALVADLVGTTPFEYFPSRYQNQATEIEPLPPQF